MKRGAVQPLFKYLFVVIAGAIILLFFINLVADQIEFSSKISSTESAKSLDNSLDAFSVSEDSDRTVDLARDAVLNIDYDTECNGFITIENSVPVRESKVIFAPKSLRGNILYAWTQAWKYPYKAINFFYLSNPRSKYYLIGDDPLAEELYGILNQAGNCCENFEYIPKRFNFGKVRDVSEINAEESSKFDFVKLVFINKPSQQVSADFRVKSLEINYISCLEAGNDEECHGTVKFDDGAFRKFMGKPMLYGAIFSDNSISYDCAVKNALDRLDKVSALYIGKATSMANLKAGICDDTIIKTSKYLNLAGLLSQNSGFRGLIRAFDSTSLEAIHDSMLAIRDYNNQELGGRDCAVLF